MSWMKRPGADPAGHSAAAPAHPVSAHSSQGYGNEQNMYPNYQANAVNSQQQQQQYWQMQQQQQQPTQYNQQYGVVYQQPEYGASNANQMYQQYNQNYANQTYNATQQGYQQSYYQQQQQQQQVPQNYSQPQNKDNWDDNWDWGWEESAKQAQQAAAQQQATAANTGQSQPPPPAFNNANVIEESFASTDTWNWSMEDKKDPKAAPVSVPPPSNLPPPVREPIEQAIQPSESPLGSEHADPRSASNLSAQTTSEEVRTLNDKDIVKERLPNLALGKRFHLENLTPQWSIESQMSQESSDGVQTHSESTYLSENQSRNSNSSPGLNTEHYNSHSGFEDSSNADWSRHSTEEATLANNTHKNYTLDDDVRKSLQELSLANTENPALESVNQHEAGNVPDHHTPPGSQPSVSHPSSHVPTVPVSAELPPLPPPSALSGLPPQMLSGLPPPSSNANLSLAYTSGSQNPFKSAGPFSHKSIASKTNTTSGSQLPSMSKDLPSSTNLASPAVVNKIQQSRPLVGAFGANLETTPDNSERPDQPQVAPFRPLATPAQVPDNLEVAPQNDRNEYLQTAHLSSGDYVENTNFSRTVPPPGLRRMVVGQQESEYGQSLNMSSDEPPPGLSRMVPGQQTEADNSYNQSNESFLDRHIDGQPTDSSPRPYRQTADGQQTPDFTQGPNRSSRPVGMDRMVPGEPSNEEYSQYQNSNFNTNDQRVVTGVDHDYSVGPSDIREQNMDGSDYTEPTLRNPRNIPRSTREPTAEVPVDFTSVEDQQREVTMEGENLQDLSAISSTELTFSREQTLEGADINVADTAANRKADAADSVEVQASGSRRQSLNRTSGEDSERDRTRDRRDKHKASRDRDKDGKYSRDDKKKDRDGERRSDKDKRDRDRDRDRRERDRDDSPDEVRARRSTRSRRYETEDTDCYSDRERDRRRYREGSSKPPRPDDKDRRYREERDKNRRYNTIERERRYDDERDSASRPRRSERDRERDRYQRRYRDIDPSRKYGNIRRERDDEDRRRGEVSSPSRPVSREAPTDDDMNDTLQSTDSRRRHRRARHRHEPHYDSYAPEYTDPYAVQRRQYQYYEHLRMTDPAAYMQVYKKLMAGETPYVPPSFYADPYSSLGYETRPDDLRGSVHSGRSSANGLTGKDTYYAELRSLQRGVAGDATSLRTDLSDRDFNTDASLNLHLEESTVRSERMTPFKFSTAHVKGSISSHHVVLVRPVYPVDGVPATVQLLQLSAALQHDDATAQLRHYPGPLVKGVTHKKSVIEYCAARVRDAARGVGAARGDLVGYVLVWELLKLMLTQNGMVVGSDIAELLMKNQREYELKPTPSRTQHNGSGRDSSERSRDVSGDVSPAPLPTDPATGEEEGDSSLRVIKSETDVRATQQLLDYLIAGNRQQALECAMNNHLWGHALHLSAYSDRRARAAVLQRFLAHLSHTSPLHTLYCSLAGHVVPAATCVSEARWGDWRPHAAILLANSGSRPEHEQKTLIQLGDSLNSRGLLFSAQFCYLSAGAPFSPHPLTPLTAPPPAPCVPPRLSLLLADPKANTLPMFANNEAIFATEIYEYAMSLNQDYVMPDLQVYKFVVATRLVDAGEFGRALAYTERVARVLTDNPAQYAALVPRVAELADRLKYHEPLLSDEELPLEEGATPSPRHRQWQDDIQHVAHTLSTEAASLHSTPQHQLHTPQAAPPAHPAAPLPPPASQTYDNYGWGDQTQYQAPPPAPEPPASVDPPAPAPAPPPGDYSQYYQPPQADSQHSYSYQEDWYSRSTEEAPPAGPAPAADAYWQGDAPYSYNEAQGAATSPEDLPPTITMPGAAAPGQKPSLYTDFEDDRPNNGPNEQTESEDASKQGSKKEDSRSGAEGGKGGQKTGWLGGILTKLSLRPPNQMILPDDKNPTIVWDAATKRWRNTDGTEDEQERPPPPPPRLNLASLNPSAAAPAPTAGVVPPGAGVVPPGAEPGVGAPSPPVSNIFKMQKGRYIKKSYVDVFNPSGAASRPAPPAAELLPPAPAPAPHNYFVPSPLAHDQSGLSEHTLGHDDSHWQQ